MRNPLGRFGALLVALATMIAMSIGLAGSATAAPPQGSPQTVDVTGVTSDGNNFVGQLTLDSFTSSGGELTANGSLVGTVTDAAGELVTDVSTTVSGLVDLASSSGSCDILNLDLGPLDLNVLGLQVDLAPVVLDITGQTGSGKLLGNLLCAVAGLLDGPTGISALVDNIARLLNRVLGALG